MKKVIGTILFLVLGVQFSLAQRAIEQRMEAKREEIQKIKTEFISERINLEASQEEAFWNIYDKYTEVKLRNQRKLSLLRRQSNNLAISDEELKSNMDKMFQLRQEDLELDMKTKDQLLQVISVRQLAELYRSEKEFLRTIIMELRGRKR